MTDETVTVEMDRELATELADVLENEVRHADEHHSTEEVMDKGADALRRALD